MGAYRLLLAILVLISHLWITIHGHDPGVSAVVSFFLLSGFVMTALIRRHYNSVHAIPTFYLDRLMRLFPQFLVYMIATLVLIEIAHPASIFLFKLTRVKAALDFMMLPMGFYMLGLDNAQIMPQAWSLGLELTFYLAIPFILLFRIEILAFVASFAIFLLAYLGVINTDYFGYRLLPGTLFIFLCGSFLHGIQRGARATTIIFTYVICVALFMAVRKTPSLQIRFNYEVLAGFLIGLPAVALLSKLKFGALEELMGNLSYGVFLNHFFLILAFQVAGLDTSKTTIIALLIASSIAMAGLSYLLVERPVIRLRHKLRARATTFPANCSDRKSNTAEEPKLPVAG